MWTDGSEGGSTPGRLEAYGDEFLQRAIGYSLKTLAERRSIVAGFARWAHTSGFAEASLGNQHVEAFITRRPPRDITNCPSGRVGRLRADSEVHHRRWEELERACGWRRRVSVARLW